MDYIAKQENSFVIYAVNYYTTAKVNENALKLLEILKGRGVKLKIVKNEQKILGIQLAIRDHANNPSQNYKVAVLEYTRADKWYKNLGKSYLKLWKKIK